MRLSDDPIETIARETLTREALYKLVWTEPMLRIAARYNVSSSYMARVCERLNVPRPPRGYWAKLEFGKTSKIPSLPSVRPGDDSIWHRGSGLPDLNKKLPVPPSFDLHKRSIRQRNQDKLHALINGARILFQSGSLSREAGYLKPTKKLLVDVVTTKTGLDKTLALANLLFIALESRGHRVVIAAESENFRRAEVDEREQKTRSRIQNNLWAPYRPTVVYIGTVAIGLTMIEMSEEEEVRYVNGEFVRESEYVPPKSARHRVDHSWKTTKDFPSGRLCLQAYSPYRTASWTRQWKETGTRDLSGQLASIVKNLEDVSAEVARLVDEGERRAAIERDRWNAQQAQWREQEAERKNAKVIVESRQELFEIINEWAQWQNVERFFAEVEKKLVDLPLEGRESVLLRLQDARALLSPGSAIDNLRK